MLDCVLSEHNYGRQTNGPRSLSKKSYHFNRSLLGSRFTTTTEGLSNSQDDVPNWTLAAWDPSLDALDARHDLPLEHGQRIVVVAHFFLDHGVVEVCALRLKEVSGKCSGLTITIQL